MPLGKLFYRRYFGVIAVYVGKNIGKKLAFGQKRELPRSLAPFRFPKARDNSRNINE